MKKIKFTDHVLPHLVAVGVFLLVTIFFFNPVFFENKTLLQGDIQQFIGSSKSIVDYRAQTGDEPLWTNSMFSGMPAYLVSVQWSNEAIAWVKKVMSLGLPHPISNIFVAFISYYILLLAFRIRPYLAIAGAIAFGLSTYLIIGLAAGHNGRIGAIAFMPLVMAGIHLTFTRQRILGFGLTAAAMALHLRENHLQMTYYLLLIVLVYGFIRLIEAVQHKRLPDLLKTVGILALAVALGAGTFFGPFWAIREYSAYSTRGASELVSSSAQQQADASGMTKDYAFEFSNGILEPLTLMIPNFLGGSSGNLLAADRNSAAYQALMRSRDQKMVNQLANYTGAYWGEQRLAAPYYAGAITVLLFAIGIAFAEKKHAWWLGSVSALAILLSWGSNFSAFNYLMFDYFPGYDNFRSVTFTLIMIIFAMPLLGMMGLERLWAHGIDKATKMKLLIAFGCTGGLCLFFWLFAGVFSFTRSVESQLPAWFVDALADDRKRLFRSDAFRSFAFILVTFIVIYFDLHKKVSPFGFYAFLIFMMTVDLAVVNKRYFTQANFKRARDNSFFAMTEADQTMLADKSYYRVYNLSYLTGTGENPFAEARTSYYHHSIGGYHAAKLRRYSEFYDSCIVSDTRKFVDKAQKGNIDFSDLHAINMLNIKYIVIGPKQDDVMRNNSVFGNAWFVRNIVRAANPTQELQETCSVNTRMTAVIDTTKFPVGATSADTASSVTLTELTPKHLKYETRSSDGGLVMFSEIYYPGWEAAIDGKEANILRADYIFRALEVPAGNHTVEFTFKPKAYTVGNKVTAATSWLVVLLLMASIYWTLRSQEDTKRQGA
jgi:hypothetical protein